MHAIALTLTVILAAVLRLANLSHNPIALNQDEAVNGYDAYSLLMTLHDHHGNFLPVMLEAFGDWASPAITYLTIPFVQLLGLSEFSVRLPVALLGIGSVLLMYGLAKQLLHQKKFASIAAFLLAIMPWHITLSRWAIPPSITPFFVLLFAVVFLWAVNSNTGRYQFLLVAVCGAILTYTYPTQKLFVPLFLFALSVIFLRKKVAELLIVWPIYLILVAPIYWITLSEPTKYNARFNDVSIFSGNNLFGILGNFLSRYISYFLPEFNFGLGDASIMHKVPGFGSTYDFLTLFFYLGVVVCLLKVFKQEDLPYLDRNRVLLLLAWLLLAPVPASLTKDYNHVLRVAHGLPVILLFAVLGVMAIVYSLNSLKLRKSVMIAIVLVGIFNIASFSDFYFLKYPERTKFSYQYGIKDFMGYVFSRESEFPQIVIDEKINQPYIYYLFYSKYNPKLIDYRTIVPRTPIKRIGKYEFREVTDQEIAHATEVYQVADRTRTWYRIYQSDHQTLWVKRVPRDREGAM